MKRLGSRVTAGAVLSLVLAMPARAILGLGDIVFDPSNFEQAVRQLIQMEQQYEQLVRTYAVVRSQYEQMIWMARSVPVNMTTRYRSAYAPWRNSSAANAHGTSSAWVNSINTGLNVAAGYAEAVESLANYGSAISSIPSSHIDRIRKNYSTVELTDGANLSAMATIGQLRANGPVNESVIRALEDDSLSARPDMNTEIAVLNKINAAGILAVRSAQDSNKILVALAEEEIISAKRTRDAEVRAINNHIRFVREGRAVLASQSAGASQAMLAYRMP